MYAVRREELKYIDAFHPPTIFDEAIDLYKEWHHFVFFDRQKKLFGLLNLSVTGNQNNPKKGIATVIMVLTDSTLRWRGNIESFSVRSLRFSNLHPSILLGRMSVIYENGLYQIFGKLQSQRTLVDLRFKIDFSPVTSKPIPPGGFSPVWKDWVGVPRLTVDGTLFVEEEEFKITKGIGYHDHNRGRFKWGDPFGWDGGFLLEDVVFDELGPVVIGFFIDRSVDARSGRQSVVFLWTRDGPRKIFSSHQVQTKQSGVFEGPYHKLPGTARILWPERPRSVPSVIKIIATDNRDEIQIDLEPVTLCQIISSNHLGKGETIWNEIYGITRVKGLIEGKTICKKTKGYLESVRPAR